MLAPFASRRTDKVMQLGNPARFLASLASLGWRRLTLLAVAGVTAFTVVIGGSWYLSRPALEVAFVGLGAADVARIGVVLRDNGIAWDVSTDGTRVLVAKAQTSRARALLAQRGLPGSGGGWELFDKLGPMGLTSFMQEVTRARALEGELARTIQGLRGVIAARVHIVMADPGSFRRAAQPPSASVVIRTELADDATAVPAIRHLVAAAVPGMTVENVRILSAHGAVLSAEGDDSAPSRLHELQRNVATSLQNNVRRTLAPYLGVGNIEVSASVVLNIDRRQTTETAFDPDKRVERSSRVVRESGSTQTGANRQTVSVEQNVPGEPAAAAGEASRKATQKREEINNFEVPSRSTATTSAGYRVERIAAAVVVNRKRLVEQLGGSPSPEALTREIAEIERLAAAAAGIDAARGDKLTVAALDFGAETQSLQPAPAPGATELLASHAGTALQAGAILIVALLVLILGFRPLTRALLRVPAPAPQAPQALVTGTAGSAGAAIAGAAGSGIGATPPVEAATRPVSRIAAAFEQRRDALPGRRVAEMVELDREQAVTVLRRWVREGAGR